MFVPAIGAEPRKPWERPTDSGFRRPDFVLHDRLYPKAQTHLYDHLTNDERESEVKPPHRPHDLAHKRTVEAFAAHEARIAEFGIKEWADRLLEVIQESRQLQSASGRLILFICHSTGGSVVKDALSRQYTAGQSDITAECVGVWCFATPHHGSSVLSELEYVQTVQFRLGLKWRMSQHLRREFLLRNTDLEALNNEFAVSIVGTKIYNYVEGFDTSLNVFGTNDIGVEVLTAIRLCIVDRRSARFSTPELHLEHEEIIEMNTTHVDAPRFQSEDTMYGCFLDEITAVMKGYDTEENTAYHALNNTIMTGVEVDVHQFYESTQGMKISSTHPCIRAFLELGPSKCMEDRLREFDDQRSPQSDESTIPRIIIRRALGATWGRDSCCC